LRERSHHSRFRKIIYELKGTADGKAYEIEIDENGVVLEIESGDDDDDDDDDDDQR